MNEYLSKEFIAKVLDAHMLDSNGAEHYAYSTLQREFMVSPKSDVVEVKHGRWYLADDGDGVVCSECGEDFCNIYLEVDRFKYCPHCGSKMNKES